MNGTGRGEYRQELLAALSALLSQRVVLHYEIVRSNGVVMDDHPATTTLLAPGRELLEQPGRNVLPRHLHQSEMGHIEDLGPGLVLGQGLLETPQHGLLVVDRLHVDEVDNDDPADVRSRS